MLVSFSRIGILLSVRYKTSLQVDSFLLCQGDNSSIYRVKMRSVRKLVPLYHPCFCRIDNSTSHARFGKIDVIYGALLLDSLLLSDFFVCYLSVSIIVSIMFLCWILCNKMVVTQTAVVGGLTYFSVLLGVML